MKHLSHAKLVDKTEVFIRKQIEREPFAAYLMEELVKTVHIPRMALLIVVEAMKNITRDVLEDEIP